MVKEHKLSLSVQYASSGDNLPTRPQFRRWVRAALQRDVQIVLRIVDDKEGLALNKNFSGKDYATNVLTFVDDSNDLLHGDLAICAPVVEKEAREQHKELHAHYAHLTIHATLHLQGYDHQDQDQAVAMELFETAIMQKLGYANPY